MLANIHVYQQEMSHLGIKLGTRLSARHACGAFYLSLLVFFSGMVTGYYHNVFGALEKTILQSRNMNMTERVDAFFCDLSYTDCLCSRSTNESSSSHNCITSTQLTITRVLPLVSFLGQIYLIRMLFSFTGDQRHLVTYTLWILSIFIFIAITIGIHWSSCYHAYVSYIIFVTACVLLSLSMRNVLIVHRHFVFQSNRTQVAIVSKLETDAKESKPWQELI